MEEIKGGKLVTNITVVYRDVSPLVVDKLSQELWDLCAKYNINSCVLDQSPLEVKI